MEFLARGLPVLYARGNPSARLGYLSLYGGFMLTSLLFESIPRGQYYFALGIILLLALVVLLLLHAASAAEERSRYNTLMDELRRTPVNAHSEETNSLMLEYDARFAVLTPTEREISQYLILNMSNSEIANLMFITVSTLKKHNTNIYKKMGVANRADLCLYAAHARKL
jgi:DNA-binding CsgD family transcriptional regulator